jgi:acetyl esterase/lipase
MSKVFKLIGFFAACMIILSSCNRFLRPAAKQRKANQKSTTGNSGNNKNDVFSGTAIKDITYTSSVTYNGNQQQLGLDIYKPPNAAGKKFPAVILIHGGSFVGGNSPISENRTCF